MQFQADLLRTRVVRPRTTETTALGAAYLAGLAVGLWRSRAEIAALWAEDRDFRPALAPARARDLHSGWRAAVARARSGPGG
jgi:glycerol kinase